MRELNPDLIRLVASRFDELRGLQTAGDASVLLGFSGALFAAQAMDQGRLGGLAMTTVGITLAAWLIYWAFVLRRRLDLRYATRFGRVGPKRFTASRVVWVVCAMNWAGMWVSVAGPVWVRAPLALSVMVPLIGWAGWIARRDAPFRSHWAIVAIALVVITLQWPMSDPAADTLWQTRAYLYAGAALLIAGFADHALLLRAMPSGADLPDEAGDRA
jgi:hypothetical protein